MLIAAALLLFAPHPSRGLATYAPGDGLVVPNSEMLNQPGDLTLEAWVRPSPKQLGGPFHFIVSKNYSGMGFALVFIASRGRFRFQFEATDTIATAESPMRAWQNRWWHVVGVMRSGKRIELFLNGIKVAEKPTAAVLQRQEGPLTIGTSPWDTFIGTIGEVRIWNVARSPEEIVADATKTLRGNEAGLLADWNFAHYGKGLVYDITHHTKPGELQGKARIVRVKS